MGLKRKWIVFIIIVGVGTLAIANAQSRRSAGTLWIDQDTNHIEEPAEREIGRYHSVLKSVVLEQLNQVLDVPRWFRTLARAPKEAANVNALDEIPDSSWYTNRHHLRPMTIDALIRGPNQYERPNFDGGVITGVKIQGVTPGLEMRDRKGDLYVIKFDAAAYPELQSGAEVISTKILHAAGYNVPENYIAYIRPDRINIGPGVQIEDVQTLQQRKFTGADLSEILSKVARRPNGTYRVLASKILSGKPKGPFSHVGTRRDDPNDRIPHEHRRELRGLRVIASWINHWDMKEENSLDMYVERNGRNFLSHFLIDFGSTLGGALHPTKYSHGRESAFDAHRIFKEIASLGLYKSASEKKGQFVSPGMGIFSNDDFDPGAWKPILPVIPFENMTDDDALWGTRIILSFKEQELRRIIQTAEYSNPMDADYLLKTLLERRRMISAFWLSKANPIADFRVERRGEMQMLMFNNLMPANTGSLSYLYEIKTLTTVSKRLETPKPHIVLEPLLFKSDEQDLDVPLIEIAIRTERAGAVSDSVRVHLDKMSRKDGLQVVRISR